ncbi:MAG TPA: hypothetical protein DIT13_07840 [Verrucomicrobiales bacterium]|nr:hypothetical protein [Verrucomicrobiales bacterium]
MSDARMTFEMFRQAPLAALAVMLFTFTDGVVSLHELLFVIPVSALFLTGLTLGWRTGQPFWNILTWVALMAGSRMAGVHDAGVSLALFLQWLCIVIILTGLPLLMFPAWFREKGRILPDKWE